MNAHESTAFYFKEAARRMELPPRMGELLLAPRREIQFQCTIDKDDGSLAIYRGFRVQHQDARGPLFGGVRVLPQLNVFDLGGLAAVNTWKAAVANVPFGGSRGGISCDPNKLSQREWERLIRTYVRQVYDFIGPSRDILGPDVNTDEQVMAWMFDEYGRREGYSPAIVLGKPVDAHGSYGRREAPGRGLGLIARRMLADQNKRVVDVKVAVQGFGNLGRAVALWFFQQGAKVVAVTDRASGVRRDDGLHIPSLLDHASEGRSLAGFPGADPVNADDVLGLEVDVLVPASLGSVIDEHNVDEVRAGLILEGADAAIRPQAELALRKRGVPVVPDVLAGAGGMIGSYLEWVQNMQRYRWSEERVNAELDQMVGASLDTVLEIAQGKQVPLRTAAYILAIGRVGKSTVLRGV